MIISPIGGPRQIIVQAKTYKFYSWFFSQRMDDKLSLNSHDDNNKGYAVEGIWLPSKDVFIVSLHMSFSKGYVNVKSNERRASHGYQDYSLSSSL